jgi:hypothetical protein
MSTTLRIVKPVVAQRIAADECGAPAQAVQLGQPGAHHRHCEIYADGSATGHPGGQLGQQIAGARANIKRKPLCRRRHSRDGVGPPAAVHAAGHDPVHTIVAGRDPRKHPLDVDGFFFGCW